MIPGEIDDRQRPDGLRAVQYALTKCFPMDAEQSLDEKFMNRAYWRVNEKARIYHGSLPCRERTPHQS